MTKVADLLYECRQRGIHLWAEDGRLRFDAPKGALVGELRAALQARKAEIVSFLEKAAPRSRELAEEALEPRARDGDSPLSFGQERLWFLHRLLGSGAAAYHIAFTLRLSGRLDLPSFRAAASAVIERHEVLRTAFVEADGTPRQRVLRRLAPPLLVADLRALPGAQGVAAARRAMASAHEGPFDLERPPLFRLALLRLGDEEWRLAAALHHIIADGWSVGVLVRELAAAYASRTTPPGPPLAVQYADWAVWQRRREARYAAQLATSCETLAGAPRQLELATDRPRPPRAGGAGGAVSLRLDPRLASGRGATLFMTLHAVLAAWLARHAGADDVVLGTPVANRRPRQVEPLIGFFVNTLVLRIDAGGDPRFAELVERARRADLLAYDRQDVPFERLVEALDPERDLARTPLFNVFMTVEESTAPPELPGLTVETLPSEVRSAKFDLSFSFVEGEEGLTGSLIYRRELFDETTARRFGRQLEALAGAAAQDPELRLSELSLWDAGQRHQVFVEWNESLDAVPRAAGWEPVHRRIAARARKHPSCPAVEARGVTMSYGELWGAVEDEARRLRALGVGPETVVGIWAEPSASTVTRLLAVLESGGAFFAVDPRWPAERVALVLADAGCRVILGEAPSPPAPLPAGEGTKASLALAPLPDGEGSWNGETAAYVLYTSGSTGRPKGVVVSHASLAGYLEWICGVMDAAEVEHLPLTSSPAFDASFKQIFGPLLRGKAVSIPREVDDPRAVRAALERPGAAFNGVPALWEALLESGEIPAGMKALFLGGDAIPPALLERTFTARPELAAWNLYGPTEATANAAAALLRRGDVVTLGRPLPGVRLDVVDRRLQPVPLGAIGELTIGGTGLARGYLRRPGRTAAAFVPDPFSLRVGARLYRSGDRVRRLADGRLLFLGRLDRQVKIRGQRVEPGEAEAVLAELAGVRAAVVVALERGGRTRLAAAVAGTAEIEALRDALAARLPAVLVPSEWRRVDSLPRNVHGKLDRIAIRELFAAEPTAPAVSHRPPRSPAELALAEVWREVLKVEKVGLDDHFFSLGGDSILSIQVVARARRRGLEIEPRQIFERPTLERLAAVARQAGAASRSGPVVGAVPLTPIQARFFARRLARPEHYNQAVFLAVDPDFPVAGWRRAIAALIEHHDALRSRFVHDGAQWRQEFMPPGASPHFTVADLDALPTARRQSALEAAAAQVQAGFDLGGTLVRAVLLRGVGATDRLLVTIHHLAVDGVSWRVLLADLELLTAGEELPPRGASYRDWARRLAAEAASPASVAELEHWRAIADGPISIESLPRDREIAAAENREGAAKTVTARLDAALTRELLSAVPAVYRTEIEDALLTALARVLARFAGRPAVALDLEGHGRDALGLDLSRTVGWLTTLYPVALEPGAGEPGEGDLGESLKAVKEQLRAVPRGGLGWGLLRYLHPAAPLGGMPSPDIVFNYLGRFDATAFAPPLRGAAPESAGPLIAPTSQRSHWLEISAQVGESGCLEFAWRHHPAAHRPATVKELARQTVAELERLIEHCRTAPGGRTPADFPLVPGLDQATVDRLVGSGREIVDLLPLSPMQEGMVFHSLYEPLSALYFEQWGCVLDGPLDVDVFRRAWDFTIARHDALRMSIVHRGLERPLQLLHRAVEAPWRLEDWRGESGQGGAGEDWRERRDAFLAVDRQRGFDLERAPLLRFTLAQIGEKRYFFLFSHHHALLDGWSLAILFQDVFAAYSAGLEGAGLDGREPELAPAASFRDHLAWLARRDRDGDEAFWRRALAGLNEPTPLALEEHEVVGESRAASLSRPLSQSATTRLESLARRHGLTLNTVLSGAWGVLLGRYADRDDVTFGATTAGRPAAVPGIETAVGLFINTLPVRLRPRADEPLLPWLLALQAQRGEMDAHAAVPLVDIHGTSAVPRDKPLFESLLVFENYPVSEVLQEPVGEVSAGEVSGFERSHYPLNLVAAPGPELDLRFQYEAGRFPRHAVERLARHLHVLLEAVGDALAEEPERRLGALSLLAAEERQQLVVEAKATARPFPGAAVNSPVTLESVVRRRAAADPAALAVVDGAERLTYGALVERAARLARRLRGRGVRPGTPVAIGLERSAELVVAFLAVLESGGFYVPLDPSHPAERLAFMLADSGAQVLVARERPEWATEVEIVEPVADEAVASPASSSTELPPAPATAARLAYAVYTSGSTGRPKGVAVSHRAVLRLVLETDYVRLGTDDRVAQASNTSFDAATFEIWGALTSGATLVVTPRGVTLDPAAFGRFLREARVSTLFLTTALFNQVAAADPSAFATLDNLLFGGETVDPRPVRRVLAAGAPRRWLHVYGPTECTTFSTWHRVRRVPESATTVPIGRPLANTELHLLDRRLEPVPLGATGMLYLGGPGLAQGYLGRPRETAAAFIPHPFRARGARLYRTGDLVRRDGAGRVIFVGRADRQIKLRGFRVELGEIETALGSHPVVEEALVRIDGEGEGRRLVAWVRGPGAPAAELTEFLSRRLPAYMVPAAFVAVDEWPLNAHGKIDRRALPMPESGGGERPGLAVVPESATEKKVAEFFCEVLGLEAVGLDENFFELGGHSLQGTRLLSRLRQAFAVELPLKDLFENATVRRAASLVDEEKAKGETKKPSRPAIRRLERKGRKR